jgi:hypothetical protein
VSPSAPSGPLRSLSPRSPDRSSSPPARQGSSGGPPTVASGAPSRSWPDGGPRGLQPPPATGGRRVRAVPDPGPATGAWDPFAFDDDEASGASGRTRAVSPRGTRAAPVRSGGRVPARPVDGPATEVDRVVARRGDGPATEVDRASPRVVDRRGPATDIDLAADRLRPRRRSGPGGPGSATALTGGASGGLRRPVAAPVADVPGAAGWAPSPGVPRAGRSGRSGSAPVVPLRPSPGPGLPPPSDEPTELTGLDDRTDVARPHPPAPERRADRAGGFLDRDAPDRDALDRDPLGLDGPAAPDALRALHRRPHERDLDDLGPADGRDIEDLDGPADPDRDGRLDDLDDLDDAGEPDPLDLPDDLEGDIDDEAPRRIRDVDLDLDDRDFDDRDFDDRDFDDRDLDDREEPPARAWAGVLAQWLAGAVAGAVLWVLFRYLWRGLPVVALAAALLVTAGLVLLVRQLIPTADRRTTAFAVLVGLLLTASPAILVLLGR